MIPSHDSLQVFVSLQISLILQFSDNFKKSHELAVCLSLVIMAGEALPPTLCCGKHYKKYRDKEHMFLTKIYGLRGKIRYKQGKISTNLDPRIF